jgi:PKD domain
MNGRLCGLAAGAAASPAAPSILFVASSTAAAVGVSYWVNGTAPGCGDTCTGTQSAPFCTISAGRKKAVNPGDLVHVAPGTYREQVTVTGSGTATDPITPLGDAPGVIVLGTRAIAATVTANHAPVAALVAMPIKAYVPRQVILDASGSTDADGNIASYTFDCGNGRKTAAQQSPTTSSSYSIAANYTAAVTVRDSLGPSSKVTTKVTILADVAPTASLSLSDTNIRKGQSITADGSTDPDETPIATYRFDCGNGVVTAPQTSPRTTCSYPATGTFRVRLTVTETGQTGTATKDVRVK